VNAGSKIVMWPRLMLMIQDDTNNTIVHFSAVLLLDKLEFNLNSAETNVCRGPLAGDAIEG
jgi:hypothetical protein